MEQHRTRWQRLTAALRRLWTWGRTALGWGFFLACLWGWRGLPPAQQISLAIIVGCVVIAMSIPEKVEIVHRVKLEQRPGKGGEV